MISGVFSDAAKQKGEIIPVRFETSIVSVKHESGGRGWNYLCFEWNFFLTLQGYCHSSYNCTWHFNRRSHECVAYK